MPTVTMQSGVKQSSRTIPTRTDTQKAVVRSNIGGWYFDALIRFDHSSTLQVTEHPVETGAAITDHSYLEPRELTIEVGMSDVMYSIKSGQFSGGKTRSILAAQILLEMQSTRIPVQIVTKFGTYKNMMLKSLTIPDDFTTQEGLKATAIFKEINVVKVVTAKVSKRKNVTGNSNKGTQQPVDANASILKQLTDILTNYFKK